METFVKIKGDVWMTMPTLNPKVIPLFCSRFCYVFLGLKLSL